ERPFDCQRLFEQMFDLGRRLHYCVCSPRPWETTMPPTAPLTPRQQRILEVIREAVETRGYPPSVREIGEAVGRRSPSSVHSQLNTLERAGYLRRDPSRPRAIEVRFDPDTELTLPVAAAKDVPLVGEIAAGSPILAEERVESVYP